MERLYALESHSETKHRHAADTPSETRELEYDYEAPRFWVSHDQNREPDPRPSMLWGWTWANHISGVQTADEIVSAGMATPKHTPLTPVEVKLQALIRARQRAKSPIEAEVEKLLVDQFGDEVAEWLKLAQGPGARVAMLADLEYVARRLEGLLHAGLVKSWLTSYNERLSSTPINAIAFRMVGEVIAAMDAEVQDAF